MGLHTYSSGDTSDSWSQTSGYAGGNGTASESEDTASLSVTETLTSQWQEGYTITSLPDQATTTVGDSSEGVVADGNSTFSNYNSEQYQSDSSGSGYSGPLSRP